jgi:hypothetical protein
MNKYVWIPVAFFVPLILYLAYSYFEGKYKAKKQSELQLLNQMLGKRIEQSNKQIAEIEATLKDKK